MVHVWSIESGEQIHSFEHVSVTNGVAFTSDARWLATGCWDGQIRLWDLQTGKLQKVLSGHIGPVFDLQFNATDDQLLSSCADRTVRIWNIKTGKSREPFRGHRGHVYGSRFSPDEDMIASSSWDPSARLWDAKTGKLLMTLERR